MAVDYSSEITVIGQGSVKECWFACYQMLWMWANPKKTATEAKKFLTKYLKGVFEARRKKRAKTNPYWIDYSLMMEPFNPGDYETPFDRGLYPEEFCVARNAMRLISIPTSVLQESAYAVEILLRDQGPLWCAGYYLEGRALHARLVVGIDSAHNLAVVDPYEVYKGSEVFPMAYELWRQLTMGYPCSVQTVLDKKTVVQQ